MFQNCPSPNKNNFLRKPTVESGFKTQFLVICFVSKILVNTVQLKTAKSFIFKSKKLHNAETNQFFEIIVISDCFIKFFPIQLVDACSLKVFKMDQNRSQVLILVTEKNAV